MYPVTFPINDSVELNKIQHISVGFAVICSEPLLVVLKLRYRCEILAAGSEKGTPIENYSWIGQDEKRELKRRLKGTILTVT